MVNLSFSYADLEYFLLILVRVTCFIYIAPFFGMTNTPNRLKIGLGFFTAYLIYNSLDRTPVNYNGTLGFAIVVMKEAVTGFLIGFGAQLCTTVAAFTGQMIDNETGLSMVNELDVTTRQEASITGILYQYVFMLMLIASGMYEYLMKALIDSFTLIHVNGAVIMSDSLLAAFLKFMGDYVVIGFRICLPVFCTMLLVNSILGILAKIAPQLNMFVVGIQIKILIGLGIMFLTVFMLPGAANFIFIEMKKMTVLFIKGMQP